jgi:glucuronate isomerase
MTKWTLSPDRYFSPEPSQRALARQLYSEVKELPLLCPHGHVTPALLGDPDARLASPAELFIIPDHYVTRMLYSQGIPLEDLGVPSRDGSPVEEDHRKIWQRFAENFYLFRGTPTGLWLKDELISVFGVSEKLNGESAQRIYDHLQEQLAKPEFAPRALFERFNIETLCTTDAAIDGLEYHQSLRAEGWGNRMRPTFRPDAVVNIDTPEWRQNIQQLSAMSGIDVTNYRSYIITVRDRECLIHRPTR